MIKYKGDIKRRLINNDIVQGKIRGDKPGRQWLIPVILVIQEVNIRRITGRSQPRQIEKIMIKGDIIK
jgi:hypothetical protein